MMLFSLLCACPPAAAITDIPDIDCLEDFGEIQKVILQRTKNGSTVNEIVIGTDDPALLATWNTLFSASDSTKVQITPEIAEFENEESEPREASSTGIGGINKVIGADFSAATGQIHSAPQKVIKELRKYNCETGVSVFLVNENGQIGGLADDNTTATKFKGIPVRSFFVNQKKFGGRNDVDKNKIMWKFLPNWSDNFFIVNPSDFDPLSEL